MANALLEEIKTSGKKKHETKEKYICGKCSDIIKKYKCLHLLSRENEMRRKTLKAAKSKIYCQTFALERETVKELVIVFMERDGVSVNIKGWKTTTTSILTTTATITFSISESFLHMYNIDNI